MAVAVLLPKNSPLSACQEQDEIAHGSLSVGKSNVNDHWEDLEGERKANVFFSITISQKRV